MTFFFFFFFCAQTEATFAVLMTLHLQLSMVFLGVCVCVWTKQRTALDSHTALDSIFETFLGGVQAVLPPIGGYSFIKTNQSRWFKDVSAVIRIFWMIPSRLMYLDHISPHIY